MRSFLETAQGILAAGTDGLAIWRKKSFQALQFRNRAVGSGISGIVQARNGDLWLNGKRGIARVPSSEFLLALADPRHQVDAESVTEGEFVGPASLEYAPSAVADAAA